GLVALSPLTDLNSDARSKHPNWGKDTYILAKHLSTIAELWSSDPDGQGPPVSPVHEDLTGMPPSLIMAAETEVLLADAEAMAELWSAVPVGEGPPVSPVHAGRTGMPPSLIMAAETEVLLADAEAMAEALWAAGAQCKLEVWRGQVHAFPVLAPTPEVRLAIGHIAEFVQQCLKE